MAKRKHIKEVRCTCNNSDYIVTALCEEERVNEFKQRCVRTMADFIKYDADEFIINIVVSPTNKSIEKGTDLTIKLINAPVHETKSDVDIIDVGE